MREILQRKCAKDIVDKMREIYFRSDSPGKRGRPSSPAVCKMRRTSPDGESVSPSKTRRPRKTFIQFEKHCSLIKERNHRGGGGGDLFEKNVDLKPFGANFGMVMI